MTIESNSRDRDLALFEQASDGVFVLDTQGRIISVNEAFARMHGYPVAEMLRLGLAGLDVEGMAPVPDRIRRIMAGETLSFNVEHYHKDGHVFPLAVTAKLIAVGQEQQIVAIHRDLSEIKRTADELRAIAQRLQLALKATNDVVWDWDIVRDMQQWNMAGTSVFGWTEIVERPVNAQWWVDRVHPDDRQRVHETFFAVVNDPQQDVWHDEYRFLKADGTYAEVMDRGYVLRDDRGKAMRMIGAMQDITERKRLETVQVFLAQTSRGAPGETFFEALASHLARNLGMDFVCIDRLEGDGLNARTLAVWNDGRFEDNVTYALKDTPCGEVVGKRVCCFPASVCQFFPRDQVLADLRAESYVGVTLFSHTLQPIGLIAVIGRNPLENRPLAEAILQLVAIRAASELERLDAENALRESEAMFRAHMDNAFDVIFTLDHAGRFAFLSTAWERHFGIPVSEALGRPFGLFVHPDDVAGCADYLQRVLSTGQSSTSPHFRVKDASGRWPWFEVNGMPFKDPRGRLLFIGVGRDITERKQAEEELRRFSSRQEALLAAVPDIIMEVDCNKIYTWANRAGLEFFGEDVIGKEACAYFDGEQKAYETLSPLFNGDEQVIYVESWQRRKDGQKRLLAWWCRTLKDAQGVVIGALSTARDITERQQAEENLKRIEWMLSQPVEHALEDAQPAANYGDLTKLNQNGLILNSVGREMLAKITSDYLDLLGTSSAIYEANGDYAHGIFSSGWCRMMDCASRKLCATSDNAQALASGLWLCHESCWNRCSKEAMSRGEPVDIECAGGIRIYGLPIFVNGEVIGAINFGYGDPPKDPKTLKALAETFNVDHESLRRAAEAYQSRPRYIIEMAKSRLLTSAQTITFLVERKRAEDALQEANRQLGRTTQQALELAEKAEAATKAKSQFLATMSHELRTPLNPVLGFTGLLADAPNLTEEQRLWLGIVHRRGTDLLQLIQSVLDLSKIEAGKMIIERHPLRVRQTVQDLAASLGPAAEKKGLILDWEVAPDVPDHVMADGFRIRQVLMNLLNNAIKFTRHGRIAVRAMAGGANRLARAPDPGEIALLFSVQDTGIGIAAEQQAGIFEAFTHADPKHAVDYGGAGLGLAIAQQLVDLMGGRIWVESRAGQGSTFFFTVMVGGQPAAGAAALQAPAGVAAAGATRPLRILLVDDDAASVTLMQALMKDAGHGIRTAENGRDALAWLEKEAFDLVLLDISMPVMDGLETIAAIRERDRRAGRHTPVMALTAHAMPGDKDRFLKAGMDGYLAKPLQAVELCQVIRQASALL